MDEEDIRKFGLRQRLNRFRVKLFEEGEGHYIFVELFDNWLRDEEFAAKFYYEVMTPILESPNIEIKPIEREVLENMMNIGAELANHEVHDKLILASAMMLQCPLITSDEKVIRFVKKHRVIPAIVS